jgi:hypothetical protein
MGSKFKELMNEYGKVKQFPFDEELMPLLEEQLATSDEADDIEFKELSPGEARKVIRVDPPNGLLKYVPKR